MSISPTRFSEFTAVILNNTFDAIGILAPVFDSSGNTIDFIFEYVNDAVERISKKPKTYFVGQSLLSLFRYSLENGLFEDFKNTYNTGKSTEKVYYHRDSFYKGWFRCSIVRYENGLVAYFKDVTRSKKTELKLKRLTNELKSTLQEKESLLNEKDLLLKEIHHRLKNNLQLIASMLSFQETRIQDPENKEILSVSKQRITNIAAIHEMLYESSTHSAVDLNNFIKELSSSILSLYSKNDQEIKINREIEEMEISPDYSINIGIIINELLTNCLKYAFKGINEPEISISVREQQNSIRIEVSDNGIGLPENYDIEKSESLGHLIVNTLVNRMDGNIEVKKILPGSAIIIYLPLDKYIHQKVN